MLEFRNGILQDKYIEVIDKYGDIRNLEVEIDIIEPVGKANVRTLRPMNPKGTTSHSTANTNKGADDKMHGRYLQNIENEDNTYISWHFTIDENSLTQHLPINERGYHAGDGSGFGNRYTIGIEGTENGDIEKILENHISFLAELDLTFDWDIKENHPHREFSSIKKLCPRTILKSQNTWKQDWNDFQVQINEVKNMKKNGKRYERFEDLPDWSKEAIQWRIDIGALNGVGNGVLDLSEDMVRNMVSDYLVYKKLGLIK